MYTFKLLQSQIKIKRTKKKAQQENYSHTLLPSPKIAHTFGSSVNLRPDLAHTHAPLASKAQDTQKLTHSPGRQGNTHVSNS